MNLEPIRALLELAAKVAPAPWTPGTGTLIHTPDSDKPGHEYTEQEKIDRRDFLCAARNSVAALSQLLEAVTNLEKLQKELRHIETVRRESADAHVRGWGEGCGHCADEIAILLGDESLKRLLHPEDK